MLYNNFWSYLKNKCRIPYLYDNLKVSNKVASLPRKTRESKICIMRDKIFHVFYFI